MLQQLQNIPTSEVLKNASPFMDVDTQKKENKSVELFPAVDKQKSMPIKVYELGEMDNKLRCYMKGADGKLFKLYVEALRSINEILRLELEKALKEAKNAG